MSALGTVTFTGYSWFVLVISHIFSSGIRNCVGATIEEESLTFSKYGTKPRKWNTLSGGPTLYFAHRGENVLLPGHTIPAYEIAAIEQAEYVEPDLVITKDGVLVCYHDPTLKQRSDVETHPEFDHLKTNYSGDIGDEWHEIIEDYFVQDFTLAELKTLNVKQKRVGIRLSYFDTFKIPTFQEFLDVVHRMTLTLNKTIGIIPELKHSRFHNERNSNSTPHLMEESLLRELTLNGYAVQDNQPENCTGQLDSNAPSSGRPAIKCPPVIIQSFEKSSLEFLNTVSDLELMMLIGSDSPKPDVPLLTYDGLESIAKFAKWVCVWKGYIYAGVGNLFAYLHKDWDTRDINLFGGVVPKDDLVKEAHLLGMKMAVFTVTDSRENSSWGCAMVSDSSGCQKPANKRDELFHYFRMGMDGIFVESIPESREIRMRYEFEYERPEMHESSLEPGQASGGARLPDTSFDVVSTVIITALILMIAHAFKGVSQCNVVRQ